MLPAFLISLLLTFPQQLLSVEEDNNSPGNKVIQQAL